ncbi:MAG: hypothetical protein HW405_449 [Candidatus Berkelbacteria bacterium]|nr:hypothetical protein [Candidatus Berkelbacteria bacterium]
MEAERKLNDESFDGVVLGEIIPVWAVEDYTDGLGNPESDASSACAGAARLYIKIKADHPNLPIVFHNDRAKGAVLRDHPCIGPDVPFFRRGDDAVSTAVDALVNLMQP